jgi:Rrf2 family protein
VTTFSHTTGYAIEALACLARHGPDSMLVREIVETTEMPLPYLSKVFQRLGDAGIVETKRGYKGSVKLNKIPSEISLLQIDAAVEGQKAGHYCAAEKSTRPNTFWEAFQRSYREKLSAMTIADVLAYETQLRSGK